ncbi:quino amine dehydrogenase beta chain protein [Rutstroemia sp. NJR-2017a BVV2]|nr:quino amine dehydrogenase beta chain protein [Rutstroemia sp. NJR-2017a BVV2]
MVIKMKNSFVSRPISAFLAAVFLPSLITGTPIASSSVAISTLTPTLPLPVHVLHTFDFPSWCENLAIRSNGDLMVSRLDTPEVLLVSHTSAFSPITIATFNSTTYKGALGISETNTDKFYVITSAQVDDSFVKTSGVNSIWEIDMTTFSQKSGVVTKNATVTKLVDIPGADFLNGMTTLDDEHILVGDVYNGWVYKVCTTTGSYSILINDPLMKFPSVGASTNLGVNGLKISGSYLYWTNTAVGSVNRIQIKADGTPVGSSQVVVSNVPKPDDFIIKSDGAFFVAQNQMDELSVVPKGKSVASVAAGSNISTTLAGVTAGKFGRTSKDKNILYLTTSGALALPINGTVVVAGSIAYIDTTGF